MPLRQKRDCACESPAEQKTELIVAISVLFSVLALFTYDYVLNFSREVKLMWKRPWQYPTAFYFLSRYLPFVGMVYDVAMIPVTSQLVSGGSESCTDIYHFIDATRFLVNMILIAVLIVQTYAIYNHNRLILFLLGCLAVASLVGTGFRSAIRTCSLDPPDNRPLSISISSIVLTTFPTLVLVLTLWKIVVIIRSKQNFQENTRHNLTSTMLFQILCMCGVSLLDLFNTLFFLLAPTTYNLAASPYLTPVGAIFVTQFIMSLREVNEKSDPYATNTKSLALTTFPLGIELSVLGPHEDEDQTDNIHSSCKPMGSGESIIYKSFWGSPKELGADLSTHLTLVTSP